MVLPSVALHRRLLSAILLSVCIAAESSHSQWSTSPSANTLVAVAEDEQVNPAAVSDGAGGMFVVWVDKRKDNGSDIYAQRVDVVGVRRWGFGGLAVCSAPGTHEQPGIVGDGAGGIIVVWRDGRSGLVQNTDIYAQRISFSGTTLWAADGVPVCTEPTRQASPVVASDGAGGVIIAWEDDRGGFGNRDIYAQALNHLGVPQWATEGVGVSTENGIQELPVIASDAAAGAIIGWTDARGGTRDVYAQRINSSGLAVWPVSGVPVGAAPNAQENQVIAADGSGGAFFAWDDNRGTDDEIYAQRVSAGGIPQWISNGVQLTSVTGNQSAPAIIENAGGAVIAWQDARAGDFDIYAQSLSALGVPLWSPGGVGVSIQAGNQSDVQMTPSVAGSSIAVWVDDRAGTNAHDLYAQRLNSLGLSQWNPNGVDISTASGRQETPVIVPDGSNGAILAWSDERTSGTEDDIYVQNVDVSGNLGVTSLQSPILSIATVVPGNVPLPVAVVLPQGFTATGGELLARNGGQTQFQSIPLTRNGNVFQGTIPAPVMNARGVEVYSRISNGATQWTDPPLNPDQFPYPVRVQQVNPSFGLDLAPRKFKMVSVPFDLHNTSVEGVLGDDFGQYEQTRWRLFRWEADSIREHPSIAAGFQRGNSFWLITRDGASFDVGDGLSPNMSQPNQLLLQPGWNQIGAIYPFPVDWNTITFSTAATNITGPYTWDGTQWLLSPKLSPWEGYFILNRTAAPVVMTVPNVESPGGPPAKPPHSKGVDYALDIAASVEGTDLLDTYNGIGFRNGASPGLDEFDIPEPPPPGEYLRLTIQEEGTDLMYSYKPQADEGQRWDVRVTSSIGNRSASLALSELGQMLDGHALYVLDMDDAVILTPEHGTIHFPLSRAGEPRSLRVIIGTRSYAEQNNNGVPLVPVLFNLAQNYPNPFNPSTTIRYQLGKRSSVTLEVFNLLGQKLRTLVKSEQTTGAYSVEWDGISEDGFSVPSGVYLYRLSAGEYTATRRMVLLR